ncbi:MAG TPA: S41 family peptidase [Gemmataceae bacterium]|nr:S41 family peptidase [Gemmataceae bacterium]
MSATSLAVSALPLLVDAVLKGTIVLLLAFVLATVMRRASAGARHMLWAATMVGLLIVPLVSLTLPTWQSPVPMVGLASTRPAGAADWDDEHFLLVFETPGKPTPIQAAGDNPPPQADPMLVASRASAPPSALPADHIPAKALEHAGVTLPATWIVGVWLVGALLSVAWLLGGWLSLIRLAWSCQRIREGELYGMVNQVANGLGIRRPIRLLLSTRRAIPMTWGLCRPTVLLPETAQGWATDRLRQVLVHELGHVQRWDCLVQMLGHLARGLYWFHPLAWLAVRQLRLEQEQACDDVVLASGANAPDYAEHLLAVTAGVPAGFWNAPVALGMTRTAKLHRRLMSLLDSSRNHQPVRRRALFLTGTAALALALALGTAAFTSTAARAETAPDYAQQPPAKDADLAKKLGEIQEKLAKHYVTPVDDKALATFALKGLLQGLNDPYTGYLSADELAKFDSQTQGAVTGIGVQLKMVDDRITVLTPLEGSPALKAGLRPGDQIEAIDGKSTRGISLNDAVQRILGKAGTALKLKVVHADGVVQDIEVTRAEIRFSTVNGFQRGADGKWQYLLDPEHKIGYLHVSQFGSRTAAEVRETVESLQKDGLKGLILDLRSCPGGLLDQAIEVCKLFLPKGKILTTRGQGNVEKTWEADGKATLGDFPLLVLVNDQTASAAEIVAGALGDHGRAILLGTRTFGKGSVQMIVKLDQGGALKLTTANHYLPSGRNIQKRPGEKSWGVDPTDGYYLPLTTAQMDALNKDTQKRAQVGLAKDEQPKITARLTAKIIEDKHADPQLAAGLRTMVARITGGEFIKVGKDKAVLLDHVLRLEELRQRREQMLQNVQQLEREIADMQRVVGKDK